MEQRHKILILAELCEGGVHKVAYELIGKALELYPSGKSVVECLLLGNGEPDVAELCRRGAETVYYMKDPAFEEPEEQLYKENICAFIREHEPEIVLIGATSLGRSLGPRIAAALRTGLTADCTQLQISTEEKTAGKLEQIRPAFSDNILAHIVTGTMPQMATVRYKEFPEAVSDKSREVNIKVIKPYRTEVSGCRITRVYQELQENIQDAQVIVAGGRGIRKKEDLALLKELADLLGGQVGVSRALVDAGLAGSSMQVGYSGNRVKPVLYIACGISGAPQHLAGMKESDVVIAVNTDPSAPIFSICDYGYVGDLYQILPQMIEDVKTWKGEEK